MKVAIIGSNGQLGLDIVKEAPHDIDIAPLTRDDFDIEHTAKMKEKLISISPDVIINTAAFHKTDDCEKHPEKSFRINSIAVKNISLICNKLSCILVQISTDYVFNGTKRNGEITEEATPNPINTYGISKYAGEIYIKSILDKYYIIRMASLFGKKGSKEKGGNFVYSMLNKARMGENIKVINDIYMSPTYTKDGAKKIWEILKNGLDYGIYHITNQGYCSWYEFTKKIIEYSKYSVNVEPISHTEYQTLAPRPQWSVLGTNKDLKMRKWEDALHSFISEVEK